MSATDVHEKKSSGPSWIVITVAFVLVWWYFIAPAASSFVMQSEAGAGGYAIIATEYPGLSAAGKAEVARRYHKGYLSRADVSDLISVVLDERPPGGSVQVSPAPSFGDAESHADFHSLFWDRITGKRAAYKSKSKLEELLQN
ncbi:hypothetical protein ACEP6V_21545 [Pseudomonas aeruginosa]|uniref:hypothetical protein n=1 Tax=Pseudomonas aeruginosa TaxID=287 RepID=UPI000B5A5D14|nr:hypothetical protein [Pseudomonas aeruginosa]MBO8337052.1 hypothetical protein [Pseudomonas aeruginosa]HCF3031045.1 hypothetical protein [Pseudomonas aeruginosa]HCF4080903.1 hypothetical protein [Pseudomonas aeruginosa]